MSVLGFSTDSFPSSIAIVNHNGVIIDVNHKLINLFGHDKSQLVGNTVDIFSIKQLSDTIEKSLNDESDFFLNDGDVVTSQTNKGTKLFLEVGGSLFKKEGKSYCLINIVDVTQTLKLKDLLLKTQEITKTGHWEWIVEPESIMWSEKLYDIWGLDRNSLPPSVEDHKKDIHPEDHDLFYKTLDRAISSQKPYRFTFRIITDDKVKYVNADGEPMFENNKFIGFFGTLQDITEIKEKSISNDSLYSDLKKSNETYSLMAKGAAVGIWDWPDVNKDKEVWSEKFYKLLGFRPNELESSLSNFQALLHPDDREKTFEQVDAHFKGVKPFDLNYRLKCKDGAYRWFRGTGQASFNDKGEPLRMVGSIQDIHESIMAEHELKRSNEDLDQFAYIASHDLREPLRGMRNFASFLIEDYKSELDKDGVKYLETIQKLGLRLENYLDSLLYYSRLGREQIAYEDVDIRALIQDVQMTHIDGSNENIKIELVGKIPPVFCDPLKLTKIFGNLFSNSVRYNRNEKKIISVSYKKLSDGNHQFWVKDNGIGIKQDFWDKVFVIFSRLHGKDDFGGGTGFGLALVKKSVERLGGNIWVESSSESKGTTFTFTISDKIKGV